jgi:PIN domain nuclease of toxin-antitoxin system
VRLLLDTQAFLWFIWGDAHLSVKGRALIADPVNEILLSLVSYWEIAIKVSLRAYTKTKYMFLNNFLCGIIGKMLLIEMYRW